MNILFVRNVISITHTEKVRIVWHDSKGFHSEVNDSTLGYITYYKISNNFAKCIVSSTTVLDSYGSDYRVVVIGYAIDKQFLVPKTSKKFFVGWHDGSGKKFETDSE
jgi:hypothetical protein